MIMWFDIIKKPAKGKMYSKKVGNKTVSYGQAGKAKDGGRETLTVQGQIISKVIGVKTQTALTT